MLQFHGAVPEQRVIQTSFDRQKPTRQDLSLQKVLDLGQPGWAKVQVGDFAQTDYFLFADYSGADC
jgi:hypothetical protein